LLERVSQHVADPRIGLPEELFYFVSTLTPMVNVDLLIKNKKGQTLLTWRADRFHGPAWHIPGGIIRFKEGIGERIEKVAQSELGCGVRFSEAPIDVRGLVNTERDVRGHFISLLYLCELQGEPNPSMQASGADPKAGEWAWHDTAPNNLIKVHEVFRQFIDDTPPL
jgi:colanic acid biosynthesis protein WcaH